MRSTVRALIAAALVTSGCAAARDVPKVTTPGTAPAEPGARPAAEACTRPGARFPDVTRAPRALTPVEEEAVAAAEAYVKSHPSPADAQGKDELARYEYGRARALFEANHWLESALAFRELAMNHADTELGVYAAMLYLESINVLGSRSEPSRPSCADEMARDVPLLRALYCTGAAAARNAEECTSLHKIQRDLDRLSTQRRVERAARGEGDAAAEYQQAGVAYLALARRCVDEARAAGSPPQQETCDEIAYNAGAAFVAAGHPERAEEAAQILRDPRNGLTSSPLGAKLARLRQSRPAAP